MYIAEDSLENGKVSLSIHTQMVAPETVRQRKNIHIHVYIGSDIHVLHV